MTCEPLVAFQCLKKKKKKKDKLCSIWHCVALWVIYLRSLGLNGRTWNEMAALFKVKTKQKFANTWFQQLLEMNRMKTMETTSFDWLTDRQAGVQCRNGCNEAGCRTVTPTCQPNNNHNEQVQTTDGWMDGDLPSIATSRSKVKLKLGAVGFVSTELDCGSGLKRNLHAWQRQRKTTCNPK